MLRNTNTSEEKLETKIAYKGLALCSEHDLSRSVLNEGSLTQIALSYNTKIVILLLTLGLLWWLRR